MGRAPATCAYAAKQLCTAVAGLDGHETVLAGFADGSVLTGCPADEYELDIPLASQTANYRILILKKVML